MIRFSQYLWLYVFISSLVLVPGIYSLATHGLRPSIDFAGGTLLELKTDSDVDSAFIEGQAEKLGLTISSIQKSEDSFLLRTKEEQIDTFSQFVASFAVASRSAEVLRQESVGPVLGSELLTKATIAAILAVIAILSYVAWAFKDYRFGVAAIVALIHDLLVILGSFSLMGWIWAVEVDTLFVTAFLTTMSFSVHDTIVVFDRIREYQHKGTNKSFSEICDRALTETMGRSLANSMTIILMLVALILMGGMTVRWFAVALLIGTVSGTYSSPFVATPALILWHRWSHRKK